MLQLSFIIDLYGHGSLVRNNRPLLMDDCSAKSVPFPVRISCGTQIDEICKQQVSQGLKVAILIKYPACLHLQNGYLWIKLIYVYFCLVSVHNFHLVQSRGNSDSNCNTQTYTCSKCTTINSFLQAL